jgi:hypothetical protein
MERVFRMFRSIKLVVLFVGLTLISFGFTILVSGVGIFWIYDGIRRGAAYHEVGGQPPLQMTVTKIENLNNRRFLPNYVATGYVSNYTASVKVQIFRDQFRRLRPGSSLGVHKLVSGEWLNHAKLEESMPIFRLLGLHFTWNFPAGVLMFVGGIMPLLRRGRKADANQNSSQPVQTGP